MAAVETKDRHVLVIAGAGSGKTTTIVGRIKYLLSNGVNPDSILCISFTNASVRSLSDKIYEETSTHVDVYTFHKLSLNILGTTSLIYKLSAPDSLDYLVREYLMHTVVNNLNELYDLIKYNNIFAFKIGLIYQYKKIDKAKIDSLCSLISKFVRMMKTNGYGIYEFSKFYNQKLRTKKFYLLRLILRIYQLYQYELSSSCEYDFDDIIIAATDVVNNGAYDSKYKYIFVDEYQDTSMIRFKLVESLINCNNAFLFAVGDDFQSIYKFSGCNLGIMLDFGKMFLDASIYQITNTYRFSQELIDISSKFILKNKKQIKKSLKSNKHLDRPIRIIRYINYVNDFKKIFSKINVKNSIVILGRYNKDIYKILDKDYTIDNDFNVIYKPLNIKMKYMTIHKSKGLEFEEVIIINLIDDIFGFPSKIVDDPILRMVSPSVDSFPYSEERRLFYVALTRTRGYVYLYVPYYGRSKFIRELKLRG